QIKSSHSGVPGDIFLQVQSIGRSPVTDVYNFIIGDLKFAADSLPGSYPSTETGRATKWAAKGLLGLVYLTRSGPTYNIEGPGLNSNEYDKALAQFNDIIANGGFKFITNYPSIFSYTNENNSEVLFDVQFMTTTNGADYPSQLTIGAYWTGLGLSGYDNGYGTSYTTVTKNLIQSYRTSANNGLLTDIRDTFSIKHAFPTNASKPTSLDTTRPFLKKYIDVSRRGTKRSDWPINFIVMRYTDVLMMKAECILHGAAGSQADVNSIVAQVRARAGVPALTTDVTLPALMEERRREFLGEGIRWNDLVREGMAVDVMNAWRVSDSISSVKPIIANYMIYPVPQAELLVRQGVYTQNPGYN
ncbi:MAG: RagB/SusD family nutrient uptake outer membrane protein, partial [Niabella sp.]|nr:RagB/SusD family nutrient uptake outer membrane protein [Niabella sp.]